MQPEHRAAETPLKCYLVIVPAVEPDYPAAHSMDTTWCAVDRNGYVAVFFTGEGGFLPHQATVLDDFFAFVRALRGEPESEDDDFDDDWDEAEQQAANAGLFLFQYIEGFSSLVVNYHSMFGDIHPRHVSQIPPEYRSRCKQLRMTEIDFSKAQIIQLLEHFRPDELFFYYLDPVAYLGSDKKTVRPIPGKEDQFAEFVHDFRTRYAQHAARFQFEGMTDPTLPPRRRHRKKDDGQK